MMEVRKAKLINADWPDIGFSYVPPKRAEAEEYLRRIEAAYIKMKEHSLTHLVVYGDREHFANMTYFTGFDPRFEEALLIISGNEKPKLIVGNECFGYLEVSPLFREGKFRVEIYQSFSLLQQPRDNSRLIRTILKDEGIDSSSRVGCVGWKYFSDSEQPDSIYAIELPSYITDELRGLAGRESVVNATDILMSPECGIRSICSASEIAYLEFTGCWASEAVKDIFNNLKDGIIDFELMAKVRNIGLPMACHTTLVAGETYKQGMASPSGATIRKGDPMAFNISYWGSNVCRAGWVVGNEKELPEKARGYVDEFAAPYFEAMCQWLEELKIDTECGRLYDIVSEKLPYDKFGIFLNPGHLIHLDEWINAPVYKDSKVKIKSGMVFQQDVIPSSEKYFSTRIEDGYAVGDEKLRNELKENYPDCYNRCMKRREFMINILGINLPEEILPLSNISGIIAPFFLNPSMIFSIKE